MARRARYWCRPLPNGGLELIQLMDKPPPRERKAPAIHLDTMDALEHPLDGQMYDSKSAFRAVTKAHGCIEVGNERVPRVPRISDSKELEREVERDVAEAFTMAEQMDPVEKANLSARMREEEKEFLKHAGSIEHTYD